MRRAARRAIGWPVEASDLVAQDALQSLDGVGPYLSRLITEWLEEDEKPPPPDETRTGFLTSVDVRNILESNPSVRLRGDLQNHTEFSDGAVTLEELADAAGNRGYSYIAVTDHSKGLKIAGGMEENKLEEQMRMIDAINERATSTPTLLKSIEMNVSPDGTGDMDPMVLAKLDIVLGSFHSRLRLEDQTERYLSALRNPDIQVLGHPKGRIFNFRLGLSADWRRVFAEATRLHKAVEIDGFPDRQDLSVDLVNIANEVGAWISIGSDSHYPGQLPFADFGLAAALKAKTPVEKILNLMDQEQLVNWVQETRERSKIELGSSG